MQLNSNTLIAIFRTYLKYQNRDFAMKLAFMLITSGLTLLISGQGLSLLISLDYFDVPLVINNNVPGWLAYIGGIVLTLGCLVGVWRLLTLQKKITGMLIIHRGMEGMNTTDIRRALPASYTKGKLETIDIHEGHQLHNGKVISPDHALEVVNGIEHQIKSRLNGRDISAIQLAYGGLAPIPLLVAAGYKITSRQECLVLDYSRGNGWHGLDGVDDDEKVEISSPLTQINNVVAIVLPFSVEISTKQLPVALADYAYILKLANGARPDSLNSETKQKRIVTDIYTLCANLKASHPDINEIHIFLASQASFAFRLGSIFTSSVLPRVTVYQYDSNKGKYTWGVSMMAGKNPVVID